MVTNGKGALLERDLAQHMFHRIGCGAMRSDVTHDAFGDGLHVVNRVLVVASC